jgi:DNA modification methylase
MGSGMLPGGAYVTLEHEHVLVFRNGAKREFFGQEAKSRRYRSAYFFEERNRWFSDVWTDLLGTRQTTGRAELRERSAAYPLELAYRVVHMYSIQGDTVLDPFVGTGTTALAALAGARNSVGVDIDEGFVAHAARRCAEEWPALNGVAEKRLLDHRRFIDDYRGRKKEPKHWNENHRIAVITRQETELELPMIETVSPTAEGVSATYRRFPDPTGPLFAGDPM